MTEQKHIVGLSSAEARKSGEKYGKNIINRRASRSFLKLFISSFNDPIIKILLAALAINVLIHIKNPDPIEVFGIVSAVLISTLVSASSEYGSEKAYATLMSDSQRASVTVYRDGVPVVIPSGEIVVGDVVLLRAGEKLRADGYLSSGRITVDQSPLNGESEEVEKTAAKRPRAMQLNDTCSLFCGSLVCSGEGLMTVSEVGEKTYYGSIASELAEGGEESPLKKKLSVLAETISRYGYISALLVACADLFNSLVIDNGFDRAAILHTLSTLPTLLSCVFHALTLALTVVIVAVPEGLPMMIGVVLRQNIAKMKRDSVMVRTPVGIETCGGIDILFTDKTGTLTEGIMSVRGMITGDGRYREGTLPVPLIRHLAASCLLDTSCVEGKDGISGATPTDRALYSYFRIYKKDVARYEVIDREPFSSEKKYSSATMLEGGEKYIYIKGSPDTVIPQCTDAFDNMGKRVPLDKQMLLSSLGQGANASMRAVAICVKQGGKTTLVGVAMLWDGVRTQARSAVAQLQGAGIDVIMITGDGESTARNVAERVGIINKQRNIVISGNRLSEMNDDEVKHLLPHLSVIYRAYPSDKSRMVRICKSEGRVAAMTGDGINDSPALRCADVGFAMGSGCDVAKEAGDIVIADDNIASIARAVLYGRTIYRSIKKFLHFQLTMNFCAVGISLIAPLIGCDTPVTVVQMLWINIIMDTLAALAFAAEAPRAEYMKDRPIGRDENVLSGAMKRRIAFTGIISTSVMIWFLRAEVVKSFFGFYSDPLPFYCGFFGLFVFTGIFNCFNARTHRLNILSHLSENRSFCVIMAAVFAFQLFLMYCGGSTFRCTPLTPDELLFVLLLSSLVIPADLLRKLFDRGEE